MSSTHILSQYYYFIIGGRDDDDDEGNYDRLKSSKLNDHIPLIVKKPYRVFWCKISDVLHFILCITFWFLLHALHFVMMWTWSIVNWRHFVKSVKKGNPRKTYRHASSFDIASPITRIAINLRNFSISLQSNRHFEKNRPTCLQIAWGCFYSNICKEMI